MLHPSIAQWRRKRTFACTETVGRTEPALFYFPPVRFRPKSGYLLPLHQSSKSPSLASLTATLTPPTVSDSFRQNSDSIYNLPCGDLCGDPVPTFSVPEEEYLGCFKDVEADRLFTYANESNTDMKASVRDRFFSFSLFLCPSVCRGAGRDRLLNTTSSRPTACSRYT